MGGLIECARPLEHCRSQIGDTEQMSLVSSMDCRKGEGEAQTSYDPCEKFMRTIPSPTRLLTLVIVSHLREKGSSPFRNSLILADEFVFGPVRIDHQHGLSS